ncbi:uncharacterized protein LOC126795219 [Argentina anserina]|uniref:uncharacterized protein LOC126795219 n=1 Tax=Argentina anserina TaxID=57926 RepID=UPI0021766B60|nr:uncharacterized protein LOC126795219 [Potentilla anserina]
MKHNNQPVMEITVISAQGLKNSSHFSQKIRPFITLTTSPPAATPCRPSGNEEVQVYKTRVDDEGGINPTWGDKFMVPLDACFLSNRYSCIHLQLHTKRLIMGRVQLGWCQIPAYDIVGFPSTGSVRYLSYRLRARDGTRTNGVVNVAIKLENLAPVSSQRVESINSISPTFDTCGTVIGTPVAQLPPLAGECSVTCPGQIFGFGCKEGNRWNHV